MNKGIWRNVEEETTAWSYWTGGNCKYFICLLWYNYFVFIYFSKVFIPLFDRKKAVSEILLKDMAIKILYHQLMLMALVMVYVEICARGNVPIYHKAWAIEMQNFAVAGVIAIVVIMW